MARITLDPHMKVKLACAGGLLSIGMLMLTAGAQLGVVHLDAGDMKIVFGRGEQGLTMSVDARTCPPNCGFDVNWRPLVRSMQEAM